jgi:hypothetical protein
MDDFGQVIINGAGSIPGILYGFRYVLATMGIFTVIASLAHQARRGRSGEGMLPVTVGGLIIGSLMASIQTVVAVTGQSLLGDIQDPIFMESFNPDGTDPTRLGIQAVVAYINMLGWFAAGKGLWTYRIGPKYGQPGWLGTGTAFLVSGTLMANFYVFADVLGFTFGDVQLGSKYFRF